MRFNNIENKQVSNQIEAMKRQTYVLNERQAGELFKWIRKTYECEGFENIFKQYPKFDFANMPSEMRLKITNEDNYVRQAGSNLSVSCISREASSVFVYLPEKNNGEPERLVNIYLDNIDQSRRKFEPNAITYYVSGEEGHKSVDKITTGLKENSEVEIFSSESILGKTTMEAIEMKKSLDAITVNVNDIINHSENPTCDYPNCEFLDTPSK